MLCDPRRKHDRFADLHCPIDLEVFAESGMHRDRERMRRRCSFAATSIFASLLSMLKANTIVGARHAQGGAD